MEIVLNAIANRGILADERIGIKVLSPCNTKNYMVFMTSLNEDGFFHISSNAYWFTPLEVKVGDRIVLYTRNGNSSVKEDTHGFNTYFLFWGLDKPLFTEDYHGVVIAHINDWELSAELQVPSSSS